MTSGLRSPDLAPNLALGGFIRRRYTIPVIRRQTVY